MAKRTYTTDRIAVHWDSQRCIHTGMCLRSLPEVFDTSNRPWVTVDGADADAVAAAIEKCPSGALRYERLDGAAGEIPDDPPTITARRNGPLYVRGNVRVVSTRGDDVTHGPRMVLCRCGASKNQPFCDLSHTEVGFTDNEKVMPEYRRVAANPEDVAGS